ncbi:MAG: hypothetical protein WCG81_20815 [Candidatus Angelobacter sp.]
MQRHIHWITAFAAGMLTIGTVAHGSHGALAALSGQANATASQTTQGAAGEPSAELSGRTALQIELTNSVDAKKAKLGDPVGAKLTQDVKSGPRILLHRGAKLVGHITEVQARSKENPESRLGIVFDKAVDKSREEFAFRAVVIAMAPPAGGSSTIAGDPNSVSSGPAMGGQPFGAGNAVGGPSASAAPAVEAATRSGQSSPLTAASRGAIGLPGVALRPSVVNGVQGTVAISSDHNVKLDSGTQMVLLVSGPAAPH